MSEIQDQIIKSRQENQNLENNLQCFPDLKKNVNRWNHIRYTSKKANSSVTDVEMVYSCGCCPDAFLDVYPFLVSFGMRIYSDPFFTVGRRTDSGVMEDLGWENELRECAIPELVIDKIRTYLDENKYIDEGEDI